MHDNIDDSEDSVDIPADESPKSETPVQKPAQSQQRSPAIASKKLDELQEAQAQNRTAIAHLEAQVRHLTDFVRYICRIDGYKLPEAFVPTTPEAKAEAAEKPDPGKK